MLYSCSYWCKGFWIGARHRWGDPCFAWFVLIFLVGLGTPADAAQPAILSDPEYVIAAWETEDGLPGATVSAMAQTREGYLWVGTFSGLVRFDGMKFRVLNPANTPALPSAEIVNLHVDRGDRLWVSTLAGLVVKDGAQWRTLGTKEGWVGDYVRSFAERANGDMLITTFDGHVLAYQDNRLAELPSPPGRPADGYIGAVEESGQWWLTQAPFVFRWNGQGWTQVTAAGPGLDRPYQACAPARGGGVWVLRMGELLRFREGSEPARYPLEEVFGSVWMIAEDSNRDVWVSCNGVGLYRITPGGGSRHWTTTNGLGCASARCVFEDRENNLWVGTDGGGLRRFGPRRIFTVGADSPPSGQFARSVWPARGGGMWIASFSEGLLRQDETGISSVAVSERGDKSAYGLSVLEDRAGGVWYGELDGCFWRKPQQGFELVPFKWRARASLSALFEDSKGRIWIGSQEGAVVYDGNTFCPVGAENGLPPNGIVCFGEDSSGHIWIAQSAGIFRQEKDRFVELRGADGRSLRGVLCLKAGPDGTMWMGTGPSGLLRWRDGVIARVSRDCGLPELEVRGLIEDEEGHFWMPSNRGIIRVSQKQLAAVADGAALQLDYQLLDQNDGLPSLECPVGQPTCSRDAGGRLCFPTQKGLARIDPANFRLNSQPPAVQIEQVIYHVPRTTHATHNHQGHDTSGAAEIRLAAPFPDPPRVPPGGYGMEIEYAVLSYSAPEKVRCEFMLEGTSTDWEDAGNRRIIRFHHLTPGEHTFRVRACNNDGVWNETGASLAFTVQPFYWQTWWFRVGLGLLLVGFGGAAAWRLSQARLRRATEREQAAQKIRELAGRLINAQEAERRRIARELHDDFSQQLALLAVEMELMGAATPGGPPEAVPRLDGMAMRVKELSSEVHRLAYELHPAKLDQLGLAAAARSFCRELSQQSGLRIEFEHDDLPRSIPPDVALCLYRIIQEALRNVVRHSGAAVARVELRAEPGCVRLIVADQGRGFDAEQAPRQGGLGLSSMRERVRLVSGALNLTSERGRGSRVEVRVPFAAKDSHGGDRSAQAGLSAS